MDQEKFMTHFQVAMEFNSLDEKLQQFIEKRNELAMLAKEIGLEVSGNMLFVEANNPPAATGGSRELL